MGDTIAKMSVMLTANANQFNSTIKNAGQTTDSFSRSVKSLRDKMRSSGMQDTLELIKGGGIAAGFTYVGQQLNKALDGVADVMQKVADGSMTMGEGIIEGTSQIFRSIPVAGEFFKIGEKLTNMYMEQAYGLADVNKQQADHITLIKKQRDAQKAMLDMATSANNATQNINRSITKSLATSPGDSLRLDALFEYQDAMKQVGEWQQKLNAYLADPQIAKSSQGEIEKLQKAIAQQTNSARYRYDLMMGQARETDAEPLNNQFKQLHEAVQNAGKTADEIVLLNMKLNRASDEDITFAKSLQKQAKDATEAAQKLANVKQILDQLDAQSRQAGMNDYQKQIDALKASGATADQIAEAQEKLKKISLFGDAQSVIDSIKSPLEKYEETIGKLSDMLNAGAIAWDVYGRAVQNARTELESNNSFKPMSVTGNLLAGSAQAQAYYYDRARNAPSTSAVATQNQQLDTAKESNRYLRDIRDSIENVSGGGSSDIIMTA